MKIFFVDDSNIETDDKLEFFIYGGLIASPDHIRSIIKEFYKIKNSNGVKDDRPVKWANCKFDKICLDPAKHKKIKNDVLELVAKTECKIIVYLAPHYFYHNQNFSGVGKKYKINPEKQIKAVKYAINICAEKFNDYLRSIDSHGLIFADDFGQGNIKKELTKHCHDIYPDGTVNYRGIVSSELERIVYPVVETRFDYSPMHQINDIVLGAIQHSLKEISDNLIDKLKDNFWENKQIINSGFNVYPKNSKTAAMSTKLQILENKFIRLVSNN